MPTYSEYKV